MENEFNIVNYAMYIVTSLAVLVTVHGPITGNSGTLKKDINVP